MRRFSAFAWLVSLTTLCMCGGSELARHHHDGGIDEEDGGDETDGASEDATLPDAGDDGAISDGAVDAGTDAGDGGDGGDGGSSFDAGDGGSLVLPEITVGAANRLLLLGTIVTPDVVIDGEVLVEDSLITCVAAGNGCDAMSGATDATIITTHGVIAPGLIDTHNHILFDVFDGNDWLPSQVYQDHTQWTAEARYGQMLDVKQCLANDSQGKPAWCASTPYGTPAGSLRCEMDKWGELKGLVSGTTSIVGLPGTSAACFGSLARSIDVAQNGLPDDKIQTSAIFPPSDPKGVCNNFASMKTDAFLIHVGEGVDPKALAEFATLSNAGAGSDAGVGCLLAPQTTITHGVAFGVTELQTMAAHGMKLTWSPASNLALYGQTANIPAALDAGVLIALGPDWSMGGSQNMLDELRVANAYDDANWGNRLSPKDIVTMATKNGAIALARDAQLGTVEVGKLADLAVYSGAPGAPYDTILAATPKETALVMVGGVVLYGDSVVKAAGPAAPGCDTIDVCGASKFLCAATTSSANKLDQTYGDIKSTLETAMTAADTQLATASPGSKPFAPLAPLVTCK